MSERLDDIRRRLEALGPNKEEGAMVQLLTIGTPDYLPGFVQGIAVTENPDRLTVYGIEWHALRDVYHHAPADIRYLLEQLAAWQQTAAQALAEVERLKAELEERKAEW